MIVALFAFLLLQPSQAQQLEGMYPIVPVKDMLKTLVEAPLPQLPNQVRMLVWNVWKGGGLESFEKDFRVLTDRQHVVLLQEGMENSQMLNLFKEKSQQGWVMGKSFITKDGAATGVINGSFAKPASAVPYRSPGLEPISNTPKTMLETNYQLENGEVLKVINIHGLNAAPNFEFVRQVNQVIPALKAFQGKAVFAGDFNTWNAPKMEYLLSKMKDAGFTHISYQADPRNMHLDHVFVKGCQVTKAELQTWSTSSDHFPISIEMSCGQ